MITATFPEPDLVPLRISDKWRDEVRATMPELPAAKRARFIEVYGLREYDARGAHLDARHGRILRGRGGGLEAIRRWPRTG